MTPAKRGWGCIKSDTEGQHLGDKPGTAAPERMRVLVVTHLFPTEYYPTQAPWVAEQVDSLSRHIDVDVLCCSQLTENRTETRPTGVRVDFHNIATPLGRGRPGLIASTVLYLRALTSYLKAHRGQHDVVHAHFGFPDAVVAAIACRRTRTPLVVTLHGDDAFRVLPRRDPLGGSIRAALRSSRAVIAVSSAMADAIRAALPSTPVDIVPNGYDDLLFSLSHADRNGGLLFVGLLAPVKNLDILLGAYASVKQPIAQPLVIAGDGPLRSHLESQAQELGIENRVTFLGWQTREQVAELMKRAHALLLPSRSEGWPLVITESLAVGTPVVASRVGGIPEILTSEAAGILVAPNDEPALADALVRVSSTTWDPVSVAAASAAHPWSEQVKLLVDIYRRAATLHQ